MFETDCGMTVWGAANIFFISNKSGKEDWGHMHIFSDGKSITSVLATYNANGKKQHLPLSFTFSDYAAILSTDIDEIPKNQRDNDIKPCIDALIDAYQLLIHDNDTPEEV